MNKKLQLLIFSVVSIFQIPLLTASASYSTQELYSRILHDIRTATDFTSVLRQIKLHPEVLVHREQDKNLFYHFMNVYCRTSNKPERLEEMREVFEQFTEVAKSLPEFDDLVDEVHEPFTCPVCTNPYGINSIVLQFKCGKLDEPHTICLKCAHEMAQRAPAKGLPCPQCKTPRPLYDTGKEAGIFNEPLSMLQQSELAFVQRKALSFVRKPVPFNVFRKSELMGMLKHTESTREDANESVDLPAVMRQQEQFVYTRPSIEIAHKAVFFETTARQLAKNTQQLNQEFGKDFLLHFDASGKNLLCHVMHGFFVSRPIDPWGYVYSNSHYVLFIKMLREIKKIEGHEAHLDRVVRELLLKEVEYSELIKVFEQEFPHYIELYKEGTRFHSDSESPQKRQERLSAHYAAQLYLAITNGDRELVEAFRLLELHPSLINAICYEGHSMLYEIVAEYNRCVQSGYSAKKARLEGLFCYFIIKGADTTERLPRYVVQVDRTSRSLSHHHYLYGPPLLVPAIRIIPRDTLAESVEELTRSTAKGLHTYLMKAQSDHRALLTTFPWLEEYLPAQIPADDHSDQNEETDSDTGDQDDALASFKEPKKSMWQEWKPTLKIVATGMAAGAALYRFWFAPGSHPESLKKMRQPKV